MRSTRDVRGKDQAASAASILRPSNGIDGALGPGLHRGIVQTRVKILVLFNEKEQGARSRFFYQRPNEFWRNASGGFQDRPESRLGGSAWFVPVRQRADTRTAVSRCIS